MSTLVQTVISNCYAFLALPFYGCATSILSDYVKKFLKKAKGRTSGSQVIDLKKRYMGITMLTLTPQIIFEMHQRNQQIPPEVQHGVLVWKVIVGSPAHR